MLYTDIVTIRGKEFRRTYSDTNMVMRDGAEYSEAVDPIDTAREYAESLTPLPAETAAETVGGGS